MSGKRDRYISVVIGPASRFRSRLLRWYELHRRNLPWRAPPERSADPYLVLVSEAMLQQTQVATVVGYFQRFVATLPTLHDLAAADEQQVLRLWQGLGYYRRARNLHRAAREIVARFDGQVPREVSTLLQLPGVGRYTAGAIASLAYGVRAPVLDGNVARVLCRLHCIEEDPRCKPTQDRLWQLAEQILPARRVGDFNSALMELGATVCTPRAPACPDCPVRGHCRAVERGLQKRIPPPRPRRETPTEQRVVLVIERQRAGRREVAIEQRPARGRWSSLWQFPTSAGVSPEVLARRLGLPVVTPRRLGVIRHALTHRRYEFAAYAVPAGDRDLADGPAGKRRWVTASELDGFPLSKPHLLVAQLAGMLLPSDGPSAVARTSGQS